MKIGKIIPGIIIIPGANKKTFEFIGYKPHNKMMRLIVEEYIKTVSKIFFFRK